MMTARDPTHRGRQAKTPSAQRSLQLRLTDSKVEIWRSEEDSVHTRCANPPEAEALVAGPARVSSSTIHSGPARVSPSPGPTRSSSNAGSADATDTTGDLLRCRRRGLSRVSGRSPMGTYSPTSGAADGLIPLAAGGSEGLSLPAKEAFRGTVRRGIRRR